MKRTMVFFILLTVVATAFSEEIVLGKHYTLQEVEALDGYTIMYDIPIIGRQLLILGKELPEEEKSRREDFDANKMVVLNDSKGNFLDALGIFFVDNTPNNSTFVNETSICFHAKFSESRINRFVYVNQFSDSISFFDAYPLLGYIMTTNDYIIYSMEHVDEPIKRISIATGETLSYVGYRPNARLNPLIDDQYIAYLDYSELWDDGLQFVLTDTEMLKAEKHYPPVTVLRFKDFLRVSIPQQQ